MKPRSWVTLSIRLLGLGFVILGVVKLVAGIEVVSSPAFKMMGGMSSSGERAIVDALAPNYLATGLWMLLGLVLIVASAGIAKLLFLGLEQHESSVPTPLAQSRKGR
jgi:hypothetical protein